MAKSTLTIQQRFDHFHTNNPHIYARLVMMARTAKAKGVKHLGIGMLWENVRWDALVGTVRFYGDYKMNDNFRSRYARLIMVTEPDLGGFFETRSLRTP